MQRSREFFKSGMNCSCFLDVLINTNTHGTSEHACPELAEREYTLRLLKSGI